jgi:hypothetical protein
VDTFPLGKCAGIEAGFFCISVSWHAPSITLGAGAGLARGHGEKKDFMSEIKASMPSEPVRIPVNVSPERRRASWSSKV